MAEVLDCRGLADSTFAWARDERTKLRFVPRLATLLYKPGADEASLQYRDLVAKDAARIGAEARSLEASSEGELLRLVRSVNDDPQIHGLMIFYPLQSALTDEDVMDLVSPRKDVEGLHSLSLGYLIKYKKFIDEERGLKCVVPATPKAVVKLLQAHPVRIEGAFCVLINNSMRVGKPLGLMLENLGATVVKCYHRTPPEVLEHCVRRADIVVTAVPDPSFQLDASWIRPGAAVIDVSHQGNFDSAAVAKRAGCMTLPENRIGRATRAMTFVNLIYCSKFVE